MATPITPVSGTVSITGADTLTSAVPVKSDEIKKLLEMMLDELGQIRYRLYEIK